MWEGEQSVGRKLGGYWWKEVGPGEGIDVGTTYTSNPNINIFVNVSFNQFQK